MQKFIPKSKVWLIYCGVLIFAIVLGFGIFSIISHTKDSSVEVNWRLLGEMDYVSGKSPPELKALEGQFVRIPGFMVPLEDNMKAVTEFLLVPSPQACVHVPAPPPNQMVFVKMIGSTSPEVAYGPIWVFGKLNLITKKSVYGEASFEIEGQRIEPYK
ncbi:MAG: DUF3299 domain-containing protein [Bdellovibrionales bacterium]|jgi:hypothetical protein|nr:DUF3299 domain-containing protein [Bdellovibrionales bacterium]